MRDFILNNFFDSDLTIGLCLVLYIILVIYILRKIFSKKEKNIVNRFTKPIVAIILGALIVIGPMLFLLAIFYLLLVFAAIWDIAGNIIILMTVFGFLFLLWVLYDKKEKQEENRKRNEEIEFAKGKAFALSSSAKNATDVLDTDIAELLVILKEIKTAFKERSFEKFWLDMKKVLERLNFFEIEISEALEYSRKYIELHEEYSDVDDFPEPSMFLSTTKALEKMNDKKEKLQIELEKAYEKANKDYEFASFGLQLRIKDSITNGFAMLNNSVSELSSNINQNFREINKKLISIKEESKKSNELIQEGNQKMLKMAEKRDKKMLEAAEKQNKKANRMFNRQLIKSYIAIDFFRKHW